jgi:RecB family exonuclease
MRESVIAGIDDAKRERVTAPARRLVAFVCDAVRHASGAAEGDARRLIVSPYSGVPRADASALIVVAGERGRLLETLERSRLPLDPVVRLKAQRFARACGDASAAFRAQGVSLAHLVRTARLGFELDAGAAPHELATLEALDAAAAAFDAAHAECAWDVDDALRALAGAASDPGTAFVSSDALAPPGAPPLAGLRALQPEEPRVVQRRKTHYSASSLNTYAECERRWYYRYVCASVEDKGSSASFYGSAFHWALEKFHDETKRASDAPREVLAAKLDTWIQTAFAHYRSGFETNVEYDLQTRRARRTAARYLDWFVERSRAHPFSVIGIETEAALTLEGHEFIGYIDRLDRDDATGAVTVVDYKTGSIAESAADYRERVAHFRDFQLPFYYWAQTERGERVSRLALVPLKDALRDVRPVELEVVPVAAPQARGANGTSGVIGIDELERARTKMIELAHLLADAPLESFAVARDPDACTYCAYRIACRRRPLRTDDRFGR